MNQHPKKLRLTASLVTCLSLAGCAGGQFETATPPSDNPAALTGDGKDEIGTLVEEAHARGIRVVMDVVMNHPGYTTLQDMQTFNFGGLQDGFKKHLLGQFRARHPAIGAGEHKRLSAEPYVFSRTHGNDRVVIAFGKE